MVLLCYVLLMFLRHFKTKTIGFIGYKCINGLYLQAPLKQKYKLYKNLPANLFPFQATKVAQKLRHRSRLRRREGLPQASPGRVAGPVPRCVGLMDTASATGESGYTGGDRLKGLVLKESIGGSKKNINIYTSNID